MILVVMVSVVALTYFYGTMMTVPSSETRSASQNRQTNPSEAPGDWTTYHRDLLRTGFEPALSSFNSVLLSWRSTALDGDVYAEPLIVGKEVIVATENNSIYDLNADTGEVIWRATLGLPVSGSQLPCGDIDPSGITGTPVVDPSGRIVFVVAFLQTPLHHELFALDLDTGMVRFHASIDPPGANAAVEQQRAALAFANGYVYVAYGGLYGDCGAYHGWVTGWRNKQSANASSPINYQVPTGRAGGIWAPSGIAVDGLGDLFVATGNSDSTSIFDYGDSVIKLSSDLKPLDWFAPSNWASLNAGDVDLGSTGPIILNSNFVFQIGKEGVGYVLDASKLGGIDGQVYSSQVCQGVYGGLAYAATYLFVPCTDGLVALRLNLGSKPSFSLVWHEMKFVPGPPIVAGNAVWSVDVRNGMIYALDLKNGQTIFQAEIGSVTHFNSMSAGDGQIFVAASRMVFAFLPQNSTQNSSTTFDLPGSITSKAQPANFGNFKLTITRCNFIRKLEAACKN